MKLKEYIKQANQYIVGFVVNGLPYTTRNKLATFKFRNVPVIEEVTYNGIAYAKLQDTKRNPLWFIENGGC